MTLAGFFSCKVDWLMYNILLKIGNEEVDNKSIHSFSFRWRRKEGVKMRKCRNFLYLSLSLESCGLYLLTIDRYPWITHKHLLLYYYFNKTFRQHPFVLKNKGFVIIKHRFLDFDYYTWLQCNLRLCFTIQNNAMHADILLLSYWR